jgi:hypothetical protein
MIHYCLVFVFDRRRRSGWISFLPPLFYSLLCLFHSSSSSTSIRIPTVSSEAVTDEESSEGLVVEVSDNEHPSQNPSQVEEEEGGEKGGEEEGPLASPERHDQSHVMFRDQTEIREL